VTQLSKLQAVDVVAPDWADVFAKAAEPTVNTDEDPLLLSCVHHRLAIQDPYTAVSHDFMSRVIQVQITDEDRVLAETIRRHYNDKIVLTTLRGDRITPFRQDLACFLSSDTKTVDGKHQFSSKYTGMLYKLPYFYHYDKELHSVFGGEYHPLKGDELNYHTEDKQLTYIKKVTSYRKGHNPHEYWFRDHKDDRFMLSVEARSPLDDLFDHYLRNSNTITVKGNFRAARKDTLEYYKAQTWTLNVSHDDKVN
jgi:hypothetical protein